MTAILASESFLMPLYQSKEGLTEKIKKLIGPFQTIINPTHERILEYPNASYCKELNEALVKLPLIIGTETPWLLGGAMSIALSAGEIYRTFPALHITLPPKSSLENLAFYSEQNNYGLFSRTCMVKCSLKKGEKGKKIDVYAAITPQEALQKSYKNLRFVKLDSRKRILPHRHLLDYLDIEYFTMEKGGLVSNEEGVLHKDIHIEGKFYTLPSGKKIRLVHPAYVEYMIHKRGRKNDPLDKEDLLHIAFYKQKQRI